ncbi:MAG: TIGR04283 family arsenosugar biosynthesis glycosyltransferase [Pseudomonadota bacterium]
MTAPVSVIVPVLAASERLGACLASLADGAFDGILAELILADGGGTEALAELADGVGARLVRAPKGRGTQLSAGAEAACGDWLLFVHADTVFAPGWPEAVRRHIVTAPGRAGYGHLAFDSTDKLARMTERWANLRSCLFALPYGDQGLLIHRDLYSAVGGYPPIPLMEDVALVGKLGRRRLCSLQITATTSAQRYEQRGWLAQGAHNLSTLTRYLLGAEPERLAERYNRR